MITEIQSDLIGLLKDCGLSKEDAVTEVVLLKTDENREKMIEAIIARYDSELKKLGVDVLDHYTEEYTSSGHLYLTRVPGITPEQRHEIIVKMAERGIACNVHYKPLPMHTAYKAHGFDIKNYPKAYAYFANEITLPLHTCLKDEEVEYVINNYTDILKEYIK